jgi:ATP-dependent DNA helicase RecG
MLFSDAELEALLNDHETDLAERKESWSGDAPEKGRQAVCAFANDLPDHRKPGVLFVGVRDNGTPTRLPITDQLLRTLADVKTDGQTLPPPALFVEKRVVKGAEVAIVTVLPSDSPPVRYSGRIWIRVGPRRAIATAQEERILNEKRRFRDLPFDAHPLPSCPLDSLSRRLFEEEYLPNAVASDVLAANERTYEQRLAACKMVSTADSPTPTVTGQLVLGTSPRDWLPGAYIQFLRINGTEWSDPPVDEAVIDGPLGQMLRRLDEKLDAHNVVAVDLVSQSTEIRTTPYPRVALQQLCRNAVLHRTYEQTNAPVRVYWFSDRIEIHNPGGPFGTVTKENFGMPGVTDYRNSNLAEAMKVLGFVQRFGVGISTARAYLAANGNPPPEFQIEPTTILVTIRKTP